MDKTILLYISIAIAIWLISGYIASGIVRANNPRNLKALKHSENRKDRNSYVHIKLYIRNSFWLGPIGLFLVLRRVVVTPNNHFKLSFKF